MQKPTSRRSLASNAGTTRRVNLEAILRLVHRSGPLSREEIVRQTRLSRSAVRGLTEELRDIGLLEHRSPGPTGLPGRPSPLVQANPAGAAVLALEIQVDSIAAAIIGLGGRTYSVTRLDQRRNRLEPEMLVKSLAATGAGLVDASVGWSRVVGVGVGVVGIVRSEDGFLRFSPNLGWREVPLRDLVDAALGSRAPVTVANEADLGVIAEHSRGAGMGVDDVIFLSGEVGLGAGVISDGRLLRGASGYGSEVGHITLEPEGRPCQCGNKGCWETLVGETALLRLAGSDDGQPGRAAVDAVFTAASRGERRALKALAHVGRWLGLGIAGLANTLNPSRVVLGGLFGRGFPYMRASMLREIDARTLPSTREILEILPAQLGEDASLHGAAEMALDRLFEDPVGSTPPLLALTTPSMDPEPESAPSEVG